MTSITTVDVLGNIYVHTRTGVKIPIRDQQEDGTPISLQDRIWYFEMPGVRKQLAADESDPTGLVVEITADEASELPKGEGTPFIVTDETGDERWAALIHRRGW